MFFPDLCIIFKYYKMQTVENILNLTSFHLVWRLWGHTGFVLDNEFLLKLSCFLFPAFNRQIGALKWFLTVSNKLALFLLKKATLVFEGKNYERTKDKDIQYKEGRNLYKIKWVHEGRPYTMRQTAGIGQQEKNNEKVILNTWGFCRLLLLTERNNQKSKRYNTDSAQ